MTGWPRGGSSPLTRGKLKELGGDIKDFGLIPAHAGKTPRMSGVTQTWPAHPRSRGENYQSEIDHLVGGGSSPLTRGKLARPAAVVMSSGLIPAHAGKTWSSRKVVRPIRAHPRSRGENHCAAVYAPVATGSSPLTRGKLALDSRRRRQLRLIPAHAGKT